MLCRAELLKCKKINKSETTLCSVPWSTLAMKQKLKTSLFAKFQLYMILLHLLISTTFQHVPTSQAVQVLEKTKALPKEILQMHHFSATTLCWWHYSHATLSYSLSFFTCQRPHWVHVDNIHCPSLICQAGHFITEVHQFGQIWVPLGESMPITSDDFLVLHVPRSGFQV